MRTQRSLSLSECIFIALCGVSVALGVGVWLFESSRQELLSSTPRSQELSRREGASNVTRKSRNEVEELAQYDLAIQLNPNDVNAYIDRGYARAIRGDHKGAIADYDQAIRLQPIADNYNRRAVAHAHLGNQQQAIADYSRAIQLQPDNAAFFNGRGIAYAHLGKHQQAIADYSDAIQLQPNNPDFYDNRGRAYASLGNLQKASADYDQATQLRSSNPTES